MQRNQILALLLTALILLTAAAPAAASQTATYALASHTIDGGGARQADNDRFVLHGTVGQHDASQVQDGERFGLTSGYWGPAADAEERVYLPFVVNR